jgi:N-acetyl-anhydromuramyl-L-alanine amidase AmpD
MISRNLWSLGLLPDTCTYAENQRHVEKKAVAELDLKKIIQVDFPDDQYYKTQQKKKQIVLHHTVSGQGVNGDIAWWRSTADHIATCMIIGHDGGIYQLFSSKYWGHHLGCKTSNNVALNKASIGIEIDSWGGLVRHNRQWYPAKWDKKLKRNVAYTNVAPIQNVQVYDEKFRGFHAFEKYTNEQIEAVYKLLIYWKSRYKIPLTYNEDMWDVNRDALSGTPGVWTHVSFREDKSDCHPQPELIAMLKSL